MSCKILSTIACLTFSTAIISLSAEATVLTVDDAGSVNVDEIRDYRQKSKVDSTSPSTSPQGPLSPQASQEEKPNVATLAPAIAQPLPTARFPFQNEKGENLVLELEHSFLDALENGPLPNEEKPYVASLGPVVSQPLPTAKFSFKSETGENLVLELEPSFLDALENGPLPNEEKPYVATLAPVIAQPLPTAKFPFQSETGENLVLELEPSFLDELENGPLPNKVVSLDTPKDIVESFTPESEPKLYAVIIQAEAEKYKKIDVALIESIIETESNYKATAVSPKGAMGLMQLMPATASRYKVVNAFDPAENIRGGTAELARLFDLYDNPSLALAAYNAGENAVSKYDGIPPYDETQNYVVKVLSKVFNKRQEILNLPAPIPQTIVSDKPQSHEETNENKIRKMKVYSFDWPK